MVERAMTKPVDTVADLAAVLGACRHLVAITGAGISTDSGIPDYRDAQGEWKRRAPVQYRDFVARETVRRRYWARSMTGWPAFEAARPAAAHRALAALERAGRLRGVVTQNVDDLHRRAGSRRVVDLHGRLARVRCLGCGWRWARTFLQRELAALNPAFAAGPATLAPDGDADLEETDFSAFLVPACRRCGGLLKPDVTFYGETIPPPRTQRAEAAVARADAVLVIGSSLMVFSAYRLIRNAARNGIPVYAVNLGRTRADDLLAGKVVAPAGEAMPRLADVLAGG